MASGIFHLPPACIPRAVFVIPRRMAARHERFVWNEWLPFGRSAGVCIDAGPIGATVYLFASHCRKKAG
jgi:hypothetical protein